MITPEDSRKLRLQEIRSKLDDLKYREGFISGDTIKFSYVVENRVYHFEGVCVALKRNGISSSFTVADLRKPLSDRVISVIPVYSPILKFEEVKKTHQSSENTESKLGVTNTKWRRSKLYYLLDKQGKKARVKTRNSPKHKH